jgi:hypothetical protein
VCGHAFAVFYQVIRFFADVLSRVPGLTFTPDLVPWLAAGAGLAVILAGTVLPLKRGMKRGTT